MSLPPLSQAFLTYFNVAFYTLLTPFKLQFDPKSEVFTAIRARGFHKILLITVWSVGAISLLLTLYTIPAMSDPRSHFASLNLCLAFLTSLGWTLLNLTIKFDMWRGPTKIAELASKLLTTERELQNMEVPTSWIFKFPVTLAITCHLHSLAMNLWELEASTPMMMMNQSVATFEYEVISSFVTADVMRFVQWVALVYENQLTNLGLMSVLLLSLILFVVTRSWQCYFTRNSRQTAKVPSTCKLLLALSTKIQSSFGCTIAGSVFFLLPYYSQRIQDVFGDSFSLTLQYCYYIIRLVVMLVSGAQAHAQFQVLLEPLSSDGNDLNFGTTENNRMKALLLDVVHRDGFGVRGRSLTMTYTVFGSFMAAILAYSIAIVQLQSA